MFPDVSPWSTATDVAHELQDLGGARVIAATAIVGGGESATVTFSTATLTAGERYAFFCTSPGHSSVMHGTFLFGESTRFSKAR